GVVAELDGMCEWLDCHEATEEALRRPPLELAPSALERCPRRSSETWKEFVVHFFLVSGSSGDWLACLRWISAAASSSRRYRSSFVGCDTPNAIEPRLACPIRRHKSAAHQK